MSVVAILLGLAVIGAPLFVIIGLVTNAAFGSYTDQSFWNFANLVTPLENLLGQDQFLAIPLFIASGAIMTAGGLARRLIVFARALVGWIPGGLGIASVISCMTFAAISGSSPVTLIAVGSIMFPAMVKYKYPENFSLGLVMTAGSLGCLVFPALILLIYALAVSGIGIGTVDPGDMFIAALVPALGIAFVLSAYAFWVGLKVPHKDEFSWGKLKDAFLDGIWALLLPLVILFGIMSGQFTPSKAGAVAVLYALLVTMFVYRELDLKGVIKTLSEAGKLMGLLIVIIGLAFALNQLLAEVKVDEALIRLIDRWDLGPIGFMLLVNVALIILGALMDSISATLVFAPMLAPIAVGHYGMDPLHFGIVFVVNMEIGYLAPPVATNLFVAAALFKKPFGQVSRAILPGLAITCVALFVFMYVPTCSKGLVNATRGQPVWESFPWDGKPSEQTVESGSGVDLKSMSEKATKAADKEAEKLNKQTDDEYYFSRDGAEEEDDDDLDFDVDSLRKSGRDGGPLADDDADDSDGEDDDSGGDEDDAPL